MRAAIVLQAYIHTYRHTDPSREWALLEGGEERGGGARVLQTYIHTYRPSEEAGSIGGGGGGKRGGELGCYRHTYALTKQVLEGKLFIKRIKRKYCLKKKN